MAANKKLKSPSILTLVLLLAVVVIHSSDAAMDAHRKAAPRRVLSPNQTRKKVRGWSTITEGPHPRRLKDSDSSEGGKGGKGGTSSTDSDDSSKKSSKKTMKTAKSKSQSTLPSKSKSQSMKSSNIFERPDPFDSDEEMVEREVVQVQCGSEESPLLTTFVASIQLQEPTNPMSNRLKQGRNKSSKKSGTKIDVYEGDEDIMDAMVDDEDTSDFPTNALSPGEQRLLEDTFRDVYNNWTFVSCDGFFRTVFTATLTLVEKDEEDDEYAVTLENTYRVNGPDAFDFMVQNGTMDRTDIESSSEVGENRWLQTSKNSTTTNSSSFNTPQRVSGEGEDLTTYTQTVAGGTDTPIYYVSFVATCRNCAVSDQLNFPLLEHPEDDDLEVSRQATPVTTTTPEVGEDEEPTDEEVCTCSLPVEVEDTETYRQRKHRQRRLDGHNLYVPPPNGPTSEEYIKVMNAAIQDIQENQGLLLRVAGIVDLIEPDYFQGENPELQLPPTEAPTFSPMPSVSPAPSLSPTITAAPTTSMAPTSIFEAGIPTSFPLNGTSEEPTVSTPITRPPTSTSPTTTAPAPVATPVPASQESSASPRKWLLAMIFSSLSGLLLPSLVF